MEQTATAKIPQKARDLVNRGLAAMERGNLDFAIDMFTMALDVHVGHLEARKLLRAAALNKFKSGGGGGLSTKMAAVAAMPQFAAAKLALQSGKHDKVIAAAEKLLRTDPTNLRYLNLLAQAANKGGHTDIAIQTLEFAHEQHPNDLDSIFLIGRIFMDSGQPGLAKPYFEELVDREPNNPVYIKASKDAAATDSMKEDGWDNVKEGSSYRDILKDKDEAARLETEGRSTRNASATDQMIETAIKKIESEPENVNYRLELAKHYSKVERFDEAIETLETASGEGGVRDPKIDRMLSKTYIDKLDSEIRAARESGDEDAVGDLEHKKAEFVYEDAQRAVERYPNDLQLRFQYGVVLYDNGEVTEAAQQFQLSQRSPQHRIQSLYYLAMCFKEKKQYDIAAQQLETAAADMTTMDATKKEIVYELGILAEATGEPEKALDYFKQIYQVDIGFKDVADKIEQGYSE